MTDDTRNPTDSGKIAGSGDYEVGYKKPPKDTRFGGPRAPRRGTKPKSFDALRKLMQEQAGEVALDAGGNPITDKNGRPRTNAEMFVEAWMKDRKQRKSFAEFAWGKPKEEIDITSGGETLMTPEQIATKVAALLEKLEERKKNAG